LTIAFYGFNNAVENIRSGLALSRLVGAEKCRANANHGRQLLLLEVGADTGDLEVYTVHRCKQIDTPAGICQEGYTPIWEGSMKVGNTGGGLTLLATVRAPAPALRQRAAPRPNLSALA